MNLPFKRVPFVTSAEREKKSVKVVKALKVGESLRCSKFLTGEEASQFYNDVISLPSSGSPLNHFKKRNHNKNAKIHQLPAKIKNSKPKINNKALTEANYNSLFLHAQEGDVEKVKSCVENGYFINYQDMYGWTPLMSAACADHYSVVQFLLYSGAVKSLKNKQGLTALDIAQSKNCKSVIKILKDGIVPEKSQSNSNPTANTHKRTCELCKTEFSGKISEHERSMVHLLCIKHKQPTTYYPIPESNKGFQIMVKKGWDKNKGLGLNASGMKYPVKTVFKRDRACIGGKKDVPRITHFGPNDVKAIRTRSISKVKPIERERTLKKREREANARKACRREINFRREFSCN